MAIDEDDGNAIDRDSDGSEDYAGSAQSNFPDIDDLPKLPVLWGPNRKR
jgi:hypothetical protein